MGAHTLKQMRSLRGWLAYDPVTGQITWRKSPTPRIKVGDVVGTRARNRYTQIQCGTIRTSAHRVAFYLMTGRLPKYIDHINRDKSDNRWVNLRECTQSENNINQPASSRSTSGVRGIEKSRYGYSARVQVNGKRHYLGHFATAEEAAQAYKNAAVKYFGEFAST